LRSHTISRMSRSGLPGRTKGLARQSRPTALWNSFLYEPRDSPGGTHRPAYTRGCEGDAVVVIVVQRDPASAIVPRAIRARRADGYPAIFCPSNRGAIGKSWIEQSPGLSSIAGAGCGGPCCAGLLIVASDNHSVGGIPKGD